MPAMIGLNVNSHNTSSALIIDGVVAFGVEEERLTREKRTRCFPERGIRASLEFADLALQDIEAFIVSVNPAFYFETGKPQFRTSYRDKHEIVGGIPGALLPAFNGVRPVGYSQEVSFIDGSALRVDFVEHHLAHAASAFFTSPFDEAAILSIDGFGEKDCVLMARANGNHIEVLTRQEFPHSLGMFYAAMTEFLGFKALEDEWKVMGAAPCGDPGPFIDRVRQLVHLSENGRFELSLRYFSHYLFHRPGLFSPEMVALLGPPRAPDEALTERHYAIAAATQKVTEEVYVHLIRELHRLTGLNAICIVGGVAYNSVANGVVARKGPFRDVFIPPMPDDSGTAIGGPLYIHHHVRGNDRKPIQFSNLIGPGWSDDELANILDRYGIRYHRTTNSAGITAKLLSDGMIIGWFQGRCEFGDRALGNRSILADPRRVEMKDKINSTVKYREEFRPFAPAVLTEWTHEYFIDHCPVPYMEKVLPIRPEKRAEIPAVTHVDGSGRLQTVARETNPRFWSVIEAFHQITGTPVVLNTSFNLKGEPMVCSPEDALRTFYTSGLEVLVMGDCVVVKDETIATLGVFGRSRELTSRVDTLVNP
jgi:carbamoyltransferase